MVVTIVGISALLAVRIQSRSASMTSELAEARNYAYSAIELGLLWINQDSNWRSNYPNIAWLSGQPIGRGTMTLVVTDPADGDLTDSEYDPVILTGMGVCGIARHKTQLTLVANVQPLEALNTCLHSGESVTVKSDRWITVVQGALSANGVLQNDGTIDGDVEAGSINHFGTITGTVTVPCPAKRPPAADVFQTYQSKATTILVSGTIQGKVISPQHNPWGQPNPDGVYFIDSTGSDLKIKGTRIYGTLLVRTGNKKLIIEDTVLLQNYRCDYPTLIVDGNVELSFDSANSNLSEQRWNTNFNPLYCPYQGGWDVDKLDEYPNEIQGLVHVTGELVMKNTARIHGLVICEGSVTCDGYNRIIHMPSLYTNPPQGYTFVDGMKISRGSWKRHVD